jgi:hypothetical protein
MDFFMSPPYYVPNRSTEATMERKIDILIAHIKAERWIEAISIASKFPRLGCEKERITRAQSAINNPGFYRQIGKDPANVIDDGKAALKERYASYLT